MTEPLAPAAPLTTSRQDLELPMSFYLGWEYDLRQKQVLDEPVCYDARDLTTHGVVVGMTGSGKTGLCIALLEEAAIDGIPCVIIDPKGDLTNLLLQFPELRPEDFQAWVNPAEARQKKLTPEEHSRQLAERWRKGLEDTKQTPERIKLLQESSEWRVYTPGSEAGLPLSILKTFAAPEGNVLREELNQRIDATATALLGLTGTASDPVQSREHILIAQLLLHAWTRGKSLDLPELIAQIQFPPLNKIGAFDVETFYPEKDRLQLARALNNILAAPSFSTWIEGEPLDLSQMLHTPEGKPRQVIFYVAHLEESQRQFFVTLLLEEVLNWTRKQPGTSTLRALLYFDEVFGYLPPHPANPPTKLPLMTMLKQARAFGVGVLLATQNPVDIDYKALSNAGTWFVGKLQTERDKARLIEGLEGVAAQQGSLSNRQYLENVISALGNRVFLLHNVHRGKPVIFQTRHALSFLRGPMTRDQVAELMKPVKERLGTTASAPVAVPAAAPRGDNRAAPARACPQCRAEAQPTWNFCPLCGTGLGPPAAQSTIAVAKPAAAAVPAAPARGVGLPTVPPDVPADGPHFYVPLSSPARPAEATTLVYRPRLLGVAEVIFADQKINLYHPRRYQLLAQPPAGDASPWHTSEHLAAAFAGVAVPDAHYEPVPEALLSARRLKDLGKDLVEYLYADARLTLLRNDKLGLLGLPGEDVMAFLSRCRVEAQKGAAKEIEEEKAKYRPKFAALGARLPEAPPVRQESGVLNFVNPLSWLLGAGKPPPTNDKLARLEAEWWSRQAAVLENWKRVGEGYDSQLVKPLKKNVRVLELGLAWAPCWRVQTARGLELIPAYR